jgi:hypothetical protein
LSAVVAGVLSIVTIISKTIPVLVGDAGLVPANGSYYWSGANTSSYSSSDGWFLDRLSYSSTDGSSWAYSRTGPGPFQFAINATAVPEPDMYALLGLGLAILSFLRRRQAK